jgi:hypothetical protein
MIKQESKKIVFRASNPPLEVADNGYPTSCAWSTVVEHKATDYPRKGQTATGYGNAIPTCWKVKFNGKWYRVKTAIFSNAGTRYIGKTGAWVARVDYDFETVETNILG